MTRKQRPAGGWPWEAEGYRFSTGWPTGYVCRAADDMMSGRLSGAVASQIASQTRERMAAEGKGWASGTMAPLSDASDPSKGGYARGPLRNGIAAVAPTLAHMETRISRAPGIAQGSAEHQEAIRLGLKRFSIGSPCSNGHYAERYTCDAKCVECARLKHLKGTRKGRPQ